MALPDSDVTANVERWLDANLLTDDPILTQALQNAAESELPEIQVAPSFGKFLHLLAKVSGAKRILEIGTLGGYSTIWLGRSLPETGRLISLEIDPKHASVARHNLELAGLQDQCEVKLGPALELLPTLKNEDPFDFFFIDADKENIPHYVAWALVLAHSGSVIVVDNVVRNGDVANAVSEDVNVIGVQTLIRSVSSESRLEGTALQVVSGKGYDGFAIFRVE